MLTRCLPVGRYIALLGLVGALGCSSSSDSGSGTGGTAGSAGSAGSGGSSASGGSGGNGGSGGSGASGGSSATGGSGGNGGSAGAGTECTVPADCTLFNDCCVCESLASGEAEPEAACPTASCLQSHCDATGGDPAPDCVNGYCVLSVNCDLSGIACRQAEPECEEGSVPTAVGTCYGGCIPLTECGTPPAE